MSKIAEAVEVMIAHPEKIAGLQRTDYGRYIFSYKDKVWSAYVDSSEGAAYLSLYPFAKSSDEVARNPSTESVSYNSESLENSSEKKIFFKLYQTLDELHYRVDKALDDILADKTVPF